MQDTQRDTNKKPLKRIEVEDWFNRNLRAVEADKQLAFKEFLKGKSA